MLCIAITGFSAHPSQVTKLLGIVPTKVRSYEDGGRKPFNGWWFEAHDAPLTGGADHERGLAVLRGVLQGREERFRAVREELSPASMSVYGGLCHSPDDQCGVWLEPADMSLLAQCQLAWGLDAFSPESEIEWPPNADPANDS